MDIGVLKRNGLAWAAALLVCLSGLCACSTTPREFYPVLAPLAGEGFMADAGERAALPAGGPEQTAADRDHARQLALAAAMETCAAELPDGAVHLSQSRAASAGVGLGAGYATGAVVVATTLDGSLAATAAVADATLVAMPLVGILAATTYSRHVRARRERQIQAQLGACLAREGFVVERWERARRAPPRNKGAATSRPARAATGWRSP